MHSTKKTGKNTGMVTGKQMKWIADLVGADLTRKKSIGGTSSTGTVHLHILPKRSIVGETSTGLDGARGIGITATNRPGEGVTAAIGTAVREVIAGTDTIGRTGVQSINATAQRTTLKTILTSKRKSTFRDLMRRRLWTEKMKSYSGTASSGSLVIARRRFSTQCRT